MLGGMFVLAVSAWCLLRGRRRDMAKASMRIAASFSLPRWPLPPDTFLAAIPPAMLSG